MATVLVASSLLLQKNQLTPSRLFLFLFIGYCLTVFTLCCTTHEKTFLARALKKTPKKTRRMGENIGPFQS